MEEILDDSQLGKNSTDYASFGARLVAVIIDGVILVIPVYGIQFLLMGGPGGDFNVLAIVVPYVIQWLYFALQESSAKQATIGKSVMNIKVIDLDGQRLSFGRATGRYFGKIISGLILLIGYIMAAFTEKKQALHDMMAGTLVIKTD